MFFFLARAFFHLKGTLFHEKFAKLFYFLRQLWGTACSAGDLFFLAVQAVCQDQRGQVRNAWVVIQVGVRFKVGFSEGFFYLGLFLGGKLAGVDA